jgi:hypothetical protein
MVARDTPHTPSRLCSAAAGAADGLARQLCRRRWELEVVIFPGGRQSGPAAGSGAPRYRIIQADKFAALMAREASHPSYSFLPPRPDWTECLTAFLSLDPSADEIDGWLRRSVQETAVTEPVEIESEPELAPLPSSSAAGSWLSRPTQLSGSGACWQPARSAAPGSRRLKSWRR